MSQAPTNQSIERIDASIKTGLSSAQAEQKSLLGLDNRTNAATPLSYGKIFRKHILTYFNLISTVIAIALISVGAYSDILFMGIVFSNTLIGIIQEVQAKRTLEKLALVSAPQANVVRDGSLSSIPAEKVVLDDIIFYQSGNQIIADCILSQGSIEVNESLLTGESRPIRKQIGELLLAGSYVTSGKGYCRTEHVGSSNYVETLATHAKQIKDNPSELFKSIKWIIKTIGFSLVPMGVILFVTNYFSTERDLAEAVTRTAGSLVGMIPSGMVLLTSVALAVGIIRLASHKTLVKDLYSIEMLARTNVLCLDKTGTITDGTMRVIDVKLLQPIHEFERIVSSMLQALPDNNATHQAMLAHFAVSQTPIPATTVIGFSSERKKSAVTLEGYGTFILGASEFVVKQIDESVSAIIQDAMAQGNRVLVLAHSDQPIKNEKIPQDPNLLAVIVIADHIRDDAVEIIRWFKENQVEIKIISGDHPLAVSQIAKHVGVEHAERFINLEGLSDTQVKDAAMNYTVFGRVSPEQKKMLVQEMRKNGLTVAMTGDGVNDILAFKEADCSIAMASGSDAARSVANLVLLDSNFSSMPKVVYEGRRVINNIEKSSSLFLMKTIFTIIFSLLIVIIHEPYPITPSQIILFEVCVIGAPAFLLVIQPNHDLIKGRFIKTVFGKALPYATMFLINAILVYSLAPVFGLGASIDDIIIYSMTYIGFISLFYLSLPLNWYRIGMLVASFLVITFGFIYLPTFYLGDVPLLNIGRLSETGTIFMTTLIFVAVPLLAILLFVFRKIFTSKKN